MPRFIRALGILLLTGGALSYVNYSLEDQRLQAEYLSRQTTITPEIRKRGRAYAEGNTSYAPLHLFGQYGSIGLGAFLAAGSKRNSES
jgi:hypothetical protein